MSTTKATVPGEFFQHVHNALEMCDPNSERPRANIRKIQKELQKANAIMGEIVARARAEAEAEGMVH